MTRGIPQKGDILFTTEAPLGNLAQIETDNRLAFAQRIIILQAGPRIINTFLKYFMLGQIFRSRLFALGSGSTVEGIQQSTFRRLLITVPESLTEQEIIIQKLTEMDSKINSESKYAAKLKQMKSGLMNDLLTGHVRVTPLLETTTL
jgi:Type I restriction modification DNA specificity domain.